MPANNNEVYSVSRITSDIKRTLENNPAFDFVRVEGEISSANRKPGRFGSDNLYFTLKDSSCQLPAVMFSGIERLPFEPKNGVKVICSGSIVVYEPYGKYQLKCTSMTEAGEGQAARNLEELKKRLAEEGMFDRHRTLPRFPKKIAVVTSPTGAVIHDIESVISRRYPIVELCLIPAVVQGENAVPTLVRGIERAQNIDADIIIFGRGGGSNEDLDCFNSEALAHAVYASRIPTISAVGHQVDYTIADLTADVRAATPSAAAELAVPDVSELLSVIVGEREIARRLVRQNISNCELRLSVSEKDVRLYSPRGRIDIWEQQLARENAVISAEIKRKIELADRQVTAFTADNRAMIAKRLERAEAELRETAGSISAMDPMGVLARGYSLTESNGRIVTDSRMLKKGDTVKVRLEKGAFSASVTGIDE